MARIRIIMEDDAGHAMQREQPRVYELGSGLERLRAIEAAVEQCKRAALPDLEAELLALAQARRVAEPLKKGGGNAMGIASLCLLPDVEVFANQGVPQKSCIERVAYAAKKLHV